MAATEFSGAKNRTILVNAAEVRVGFRRHLRPAGGAPARWDSSPMKTRLVRRSAWLVIAALFAAPAVAWSQVPLQPKRVMLATEPSEAQSVRHVLLLQSFDRDNMPDDYLTANFRIDVGRRTGQAVNVVQIAVGSTAFVGAPTFDKISRAPAAYR